jgi:hypothetical protein
LHASVYFWSVENVELRSSVQRLEGKLFEKEREIEEYRDFIDNIQNLL